jgi:hypothetical protein
MLLKGADGADAFHRKCYDFSQTLKDVLIFLECICYAGAV